jgi:hypothetical protein
VHLHPLGSRVGAIEARGPERERHISSTAAEGEGFIPLHSTSISNIDLGLPGY